MYVKFVFCMYINIRSSFFFFFFWINGFELLFFYFSYEIFKKDNVSSFQNTISQLLPNFDDKMYF